MPEAPAGIAHGIPSGPARGPLDPCRLQWVLGRFSGDFVGGLPKGVCDIGPLATEAPVEGSRVEETRGCGLARGELGILLAGAGSSWRLPWDPLHYKKCLGGKLPAEILAAKTGKRWENPVDLKSS